MSVYIYICKSIYRVSALFIPKLTLVFSYIKIQVNIIPIFIKISGIAHTYMRNMFITKNRPWQPRPSLGEAGTWCRASCCPPLGG